MTANLNVPLLAVLVALFVSSCMSMNADDWPPDRVARRERMIYLGSKAAAATLVAQDVAKPEDLAKAADIVEAAAAHDLVAAFKAAGYPQAEWELLAILVEEYLEPYGLQPFVEQFVAAAARGVRDGALGLPENEERELEDLKAVETPVARSRCGEIPADEEHDRRRPDLSAADPNRARLRLPLAGEQEIARHASVFDAA